jgi:hypothetical protein
MGGTAKPEGRLRSVLTLRARTHAVEPRVGQLMASACGRSVYAIVGVTKLCRAGDPRGHRYRLVFRRLRKDEVPADAEVLPWVRTSSPRREPAPKPVRRAPEAVAPADTAMPERPAGGGDIGPHIQHLVARDRAGRVLREVSLEMETGGDPAKPNVTVRRARRCDRLQVLYDARAISGRGLDAGEVLRDLMEQVEPSLCGAGRSEIHVAAWLRAAVTDRQITAARTIRLALSGLTDRQRVAVAWVCCGGSLDGLRAFRRQRRSTVAADLKDGLDRVADVLVADRRQQAA